MSRGSPSSSSGGSCIAGRHGHIFRACCAGTPPATTDGKHLRDLEALNRDIKDVLYVTASEDPSTLQPDNAIQVPTPPPAFYSCAWQASKI